MRAAYETVKNACAENYASLATGNAIRTFAKISLQFLSAKCEKVPLLSRVPGKEYLSFARKGAGNIVSRPANRQFFLLDSRKVPQLWDSWLAGGVERDVLARMSYTIALAPCLAMELFDRQNKKGPATYFECLIGHIFSRHLGVIPQKQVSLQVKDRPVRLTMDFLFKRRNGVQIHLPVKMSTRERVVQAWAHQRILDGAYGVNAYRGIMVLFSETKLDSKSHEVIEICVPDQWLVYQTLLASIHRIYYFDVPARYHALTADYPETIQIKQFGEFFIEKASVLGV